MDVKFRLAVPQVVRRSRSSGRARVMTNRGEFARPLEQVLDEVEQRGVRPLHVLEDHDRRVDVRQTLDEETPRRKEVFPLEARAVLETEEVPEPRLGEAALLLVGQVLLDDLRKLRERACRLLVLGDARPHPHHVGERPVRDAFAEGEATTPVPVRDLGQAVEVLVELPGESRLADAGDAGDGDQLRLTLIGARVEEILDPAELAVPAHERRLEPGRLEGTTGARDDAQRLPERYKPDLALQLVGTDVCVHDRLVGRPPGRLAHKHPTWFGDRLDARGGVDEVSGYHALALGAERDGGLAGQDPSSRPQLGHADLVPERRDGGDQVECGTDGALGVVFSSHRRPPHRHDRVADELLDGASVELD
jgi:hypothetical protein